MPESPELLDAFDSIIRGESVRRGRHSIGEAHEEAFRARLVALGFREMTVREVDPGIDRRVPAFLVREGEAIFGHVFVEKFTGTKSRRLFGSVERNAKGDWAVILPISSRHRIHACPEAATSYDPDRPD